MLPWGDPWHDGHMLEAWGYLCTYPLTKTPYSWEWTLSCERLWGIENNVAMSLRVVVCNHDSHCLTSFFCTETWRKTSAKSRKTGAISRKTRAKSKSVQTHALKTHIPLMCNQCNMNICPDGASTKKMLSHALLYIWHVLCSCIKACAVMCAFALCMILDAQKHGAWI